MYIIIPMLRFDYTTVYLEGSPLVATLTIKME